jgi:peptidoglycan/xylan/chitin deacetylase (PgdA/CDA1 family)
MICPNIEYFHIDKQLPSGPTKHLPDLQAYCLRDYGSRIGVFRVMDVLDKHGIRATVMLNGEVCERHPDILEEGIKRNWEWCGHGMTNNIRMSDYPADQERDVIREVKEKITAAVGIAPRGWLGPAHSETFNTPDHLAVEGFEYVCDWGFDDQPVPMRVKSGRLLALPYQQGLSDMIYMSHNHTPDQYLKMVQDQFDVLYRESKTNGRVMTLSLHPYISGLPFRIKALDKVLEYIRSHEDVWLATGAEIADAYYNARKKPARGLEPNESAACESGIA